MKRYDARPSVRLSQHGPTAANPLLATGLLLWARRARDIDRLLQRRRAAGECGRMRTSRAEHGLVRYDITTELQRLATDSAAACGMRFWQISTDPLVLSRCRSASTSAISIRHDHRRRVFILSLRASPSLPPFLPSHLSLPSVCFCLPFP